MRGSFFAAGVTEGMIGSNYTDELRARGLTTPGETRKVWDFNLGVGGPICATASGPTARAATKAASARPRHVRQRERRRSDEVDVRGGHEPAGGAGGLVPDHGAAADRTGDAA